MSALPAPDTRLTEAEYLAFERASEIKHEFFDGYIYAMSGASPDHNVIMVSTLAALYPQLRGRNCKLYPSDQKVRTPYTRSYTYPDITVVCGTPRFDEAQPDVLLNPTVIVEVLSPSTEAFDRGVKFQRYREIASLQEYVLIAQDRPQVERFARQPDGSWRLTEAQGLHGALDLTAIGCHLSLAEVYEQVTFMDDAAAAPPST